MPIVLMIMRDFVSIGRTPFSSLTDPNRTPHSARRRLAWLGIATID